MRFVLIPGLWLDGTAWDPVLPALREAGHDPVALTLPGQGDGAPSATLDEQVGAIVAAIDASEQPSVLVGHSAGCALSWIAADRQVEKVAGVQMIGGFPPGDGRIYADFFEPTGDHIQFPGWEAFEGPDSADLDQAARDRIAGTAIPVPAAVRAEVTLSDPRRYGLPVTIVCPEYSVADAQEWVSSGEVPELSATTQVTYVNIDSGHWPMFTQPEALARIIAGR